MKSMGAWLPWVQKGFWAVLDQGLFSGANFLVNILLARWLEPEEYGAFAVALSVFYLLAGFHTAVLTEPMMVFGAGKYRDQFRKYLGMLLYGHWAISALIALGLGGAAWFFLRRSSPLGGALLGLAVASPFLLLLWLTRRACYANLKPTWAVEGSVVNFLVVLAGLFLFWRAGRLSTFTGLMLLGAAAGTASLALTVLHLRPRVWGFSGNPTPGMVFGDHWGYGRWVVLEGMAYSASAQLWLLLVPLVLGFGASAALAAVRNFYRPIQLFLQALGVLLLPVLARWIRQEVSVSTFQKRILALVVLFPSLTALYSLILTISAPRLFHLVYSGKYANFWLLVPLMGATFVIASVVQILIASAKAQENISWLPFIWIALTIIATPASLLMMKVYGVVGAVIGYLVGYVGAALVAAWFSFGKL